jgi:hypothetical protein
VYEGIKWGVDGFGTPGGTVTYSFATGSTADTHYDFDAQMTAEYQAAIAAALNQWSAYGDIEFVYTANVGAADMVIGWDTIDGAAGTLGQAYYQYDSSGTVLYSEIRFDLSENWAPTNAETGKGEFSFEAVALHEIGHALGLDHATSTDSIMYSHYGYHLNLTPVDVAGIQTLYGPQQADSAYGWSHDFGGWDYGWHATGWWTSGWHYESGWEAGLYWNGWGWSSGWYHFSGWEAGWYQVGWWSFGWSYDAGGWGVGWTHGV